MSRRRRRGAGRRGAAPPAGQPQQSQVAPPPPPPPKARKTRPFRWPKYTPWLATGGVVVVVIVALVLLVPGGSSGAQVGDHWHAAIKIEVCGQEYRPPPSGGNVHSHGDGLMHIHPVDESEAGKNANLGRFFDSTNIRIEPGSIQLPGQNAYKDGDACPEGVPGRLRVLVNGKDKADFRAVTPRDGDRVEVLFK